MSAMILLIRMLVYEGVCENFVMCVQLCGSGILLSSLAVRAIMFYHVFDITCVLTVL